MLPGVRPSISFASSPTAKDLFPAADAGDRHHRWLVQDDPAPFHVDDGVCRAEVDRHVGRQKTKHSSKHLTAKPDRKKVHQLVGLARDIQWPASTFCGVPATGIEPSPCST